MVSHMAWRMCAFEYGALSVREADACGVRTPAGWLASGDADKLGTFLDVHLSFAASDGTRFALALFGRAQEWSQDTLGTIQHHMVDEASLDAALTSLRGSILDHLCRASIACDADNQGDKDFGNSVA
ncbi:hypothetical protein FVE85_2657 [Porphyridium purpureum]|uniref:Uncharacterized protein n=1 Tax=Porphyridium purpureum TaxID=35688 RepID=A0A5J4YST7_PORPP|nr:hypothetical protein FVE85_2657 [Porphyridium purpureum]|eukprot:POR7022..scf227_4